MLHGEKKKRFKQRWALHRFSNLELLTGWREREVIWLMDWSVEKEIGEIYAWFRDKQLQTLLFLAM